MLIFIIAFFVCVLFFVLFEFVCDCFGLVVFANNCFVCGQLCTCGDLR